ncbi:hypothetical protein JCM8547_007079 [Rhodosporidiobolus lusitaniae]
MAQAGQHEPGQPVLGRADVVRAGTAAEKARMSEGGPSSAATRPLPPPIVTDFAYEKPMREKGKEKEREGEVPVSPRRKDSKTGAFSSSCFSLALPALQPVPPADKPPKSPKKPHQRYKHHEPAPRRLLKRLNSLFNPNAHDSKHHKHSHSMPSSLGPSSASLARTTSATSTRSRPPQTPLVAEPESLPASTQPSSSSFFPSFAPSTSTSTAAPQEIVRPFLKIRICTFNMHDDLPSPSGDLSDFLGNVSSVPPSLLKKPKKRMSSHSSFGARSSSKGSVLTVPLSEEDARTLLPKFPLTEGHPYHIVVVCGQECPTASGVLAGKVRTLDGKGWTSQLENYLCGGCSRDGYGSESSSSSSSSSDGDGEGAEDDDRRSFAGGEGGPSRSAAESSAGGGSPSPPDFSDAGGGGAGGGPPATPSLANGFSGGAGGDSFASHRSMSVSRSGSALGQNHPRRARGPYVLVEKERLLGIYLAVFVARNCEDLVEGVSKGKVTAGLIGGRIGNKGGVGISLHFASSRLLFISAHLAAHASGLEIRKANALKILEEMDVDDFWEASGKVGPKPKELSARFDQTFFVGDLNFRLNISRLHADWLCRGKDYATALRFDQLRETLAEANGVFKDFSEGEISFPPTFKYDVPRKAKRRNTILGKRSSASKRARAADASKTSASPIIDFSAVEDDSHSIDGALTDPEVSHSTARGDEDNLADNLSIISSVGTVSTLSLSGFDPTDRPGAGEMDKADLSALGLPPPAPGKKGNETVMDQVRQRQIRFLTLVKSNSAATAIAHAQEHARKKEAGEKAAKGGGGGAATAPATPKLSSLFPLRPILQASQSAVVLPTTTTTTGNDSEADEPVPTAAAKGEGLGTDKEGEGGGSGIKQVVEAVFDTSAKQRVQSWTDRVLFKSTVVPPSPSEPDVDEEEEEERLREEEQRRQQQQSGGFDIRSRRSTNFTAALRNLTHHSSSSDDDNDDEHRGRRPTSADGTRRLRFGDAFSRPRFKSTSSDNVAHSRADGGGDARPDVPRTKSLQPVNLGRRESNADSTRTDGSAETHTAGSASFWKRVKSLKDLTSLPSAGSISPSRGSAPASIASPLQSPNLSTAATTPTTPTFPFSGPPSVGQGHTRRRTPRKKFTLSSPPSSPEDSRPTSPVASFRPPFSRPPSDQQVPPEPARPSSSDGHPQHQQQHVSFPRSATFSASASPAHAHARTSSSSHDPQLDRSHSSGQGHSHSASSATLNTRFKSFLNLLPLPFLSTSSTSRSLAAVDSATHGALVRAVAAQRKVVKVGPREGEIQVVKYDCVRDLAKMGAVSDHLPVFAVLAVGVGDRKREEVEEEEE